jgi:hypothetical protein
MQSGQVRAIKGSKMQLEPVVKLVIDAVIDSGAQVYFCVIHCLPMMLTHRPGLVFREILLTG